MEQYQSKSRCTDLDKMEKDRCKYINVIQEELKRYIRAHGIRNKKKMGTVISSPRQMEIDNVARLMML